MNLVSAQIENIHQEKKSLDSPSRSPEPSDLPSRHFTVRSVLRLRLLSSTLALAVVGLSLVGVFSPSSASGQSRTETIAITGQAAPDGNGSFGLFGTLLFPPVSNSGEVGFFGVLNGTSGGSSDDLGIFSGNGATTTQIVRSGQAAPDGNGIFSGLTVPRYSNSVQAAFYSSLTGTSGGTSDDGGVFRGSGGALTQIVRKGQVAPDNNGTFSGLSVQGINDSGRVLFVGDLIGTSGGSSDNRGIFRGSGGTITQIARKGQLAPDGNGAYFDLSSLSNLNASSQVAFRTRLTGTLGGTSDDSGIFRGGVETVQIVREGQAAPDGVGVFSDLFSSGSTPVINNLGQVAFYARLTGLGAPINENEGIFRGAGGAVTQIARKGQAAPDGNGTFSSFFSPSLNNAGQAAFTGFFTGTSGGSNDDEGIFRGSGGAITQIARKGQAAPDGNGTFVALNSPAINDVGQTAFHGFLTGTSGGLSDRHGIYTGDGIELFQVIRLGDSLGGSTVSDLFFSSSKGLNNMGQVAYRAQLANGSQSVNLWTPDLHWRAPISSSWNTAARWTLGLNPDFVHNVFIDPATDISVTGPTTDRTVRSLTVGGGTGVATLNLNSGVVLTATYGVSIKSTGKVTGEGSIAGNVVNNGLIQVGVGSQMNFLDDLLQNGVMHVGSDLNGQGTAVIHGTFGGDGGFVGGGDVLVLGELRPGNSPASVLYDGNLFLGATAGTYIELAGLNVGEFDQLLVTGDLNLAGDLFVSLIGGHTLGFNQEYLIADIGGSLLGQFNGLGEGDLVGSFNGMDLFISYDANGGSGISLFTAVPEPGSGILVLMAGLILLRPRRRSSGGDDSDRVE